MGTDKALPPWKKAQNPGSGRDILGTLLQRVIPG